MWVCIGRIKGDEVSQSAEPLCAARAFKPGCGGEAAGRTSGAGGCYCCFQWISWIQSMPGLLERTSLSVARESRSGAFKGSSFTEGQRSCLEQGTYCTLFKTWIMGHSSKYWFYKMPFSSCRKICLNTEVFIVVRHTLLWFSEESMFQQCW